MDTDSTAHELNIIPEGGTGAHPIAGCVLGYALPGLLLLNVLLPNASMALLMLLVTNFRSELLCAEPLAVWTRLRI